MTTKAQQYEQVCTRMYAAALAWLTMRPGVQLAFNGLPAHYLAQLPKGVDPKQAAIIAVLSDCFDWWPANEDTRSLLKEIDRASGGEATYLMADAVIKMVTDGAVWGGRAKA